MTRKITTFLLFSSIFHLIQAQIPQPVKQFLKADYMQGATFTLAVQEVNSGEFLYQFDEKREVIPASVLKTVTTATALELLGEKYTYPTSLEYDGEIKEGVLHGNLYIKGSGDPTLGSEHFAPDRSSFTPGQNTFIPQWIAALKKAGIHTITGTVIADESVFDTEGIGSKWVTEDLGSYYGAGSYGISVFDNLYKLNLSVGTVGSKPVITGSSPDVSYLNFHNYLVTAPVSTDSAYIIGFPFSNERFLYGAVPANREQVILKGDIPDPAFFLADYLTKKLNKEGITVQGEPTCIRLRQEAGLWDLGKRQELITTHSPALKEIIKVTNVVSHNLYADALFKTIGLTYQSVSGEVLSSYGRGVKATTSFWKEKGLDISSLWMYDGSGLAPANKVSASFINEMLIYMATQSSAPDVFIQSLPQAGIDGSVRNFLRGTPLQGKARIKSGGMSRVRCYAGYITIGGKQYAVSLFVNNYACESRILVPAIEKMLVALFSNFW